MQHTSLGHTGLMNFGPQTSETDSFAIMDQALEQEINFIDTANAW